MLEFATTRRIVLIARRLQCGRHHRRDVATFKGRISPSAPCLTTSRLPKTELRRNTAACAAAEFELLGQITVAEVPPCRLNYSRYHSPALPSRPSAFAHIRHDMRDPSFCSLCMPAERRRRTGRIFSNICAPHVRFASFEAYPRFRKERGA
jgi:hypothetical protein